MRKHRKLFVLLITVFMIPVSAWANMGIPIENPVDRKMMFDPDPGIKMLEETVAISIEEENRLHSAEVNVSYVLRNEETEDMLVEMIFVTPYMGEKGSLEVRSRGRMIEIGEPEPLLEAPQNWDASQRMQIVEPVSGKILEKSPSAFERGPYSNEGTVAWGTHFFVNLPAGEDTALEVAYDSESGFYRYQDVIKSIYSQIYYLTPAKYYNGKPKVTLKVDFPEGMEIALHSNIPMDMAGENSYIAELEGIPEEEWLITFVDRSGLFLGTNKRALNNYPVLSFFTVMAALAIWLWKSKKKKGGAVLFLLAGALSLFLLKPSYGSLFLLYMASPLMAIALLIFAAVWIAKRVMANRRKL